MPSYIPRTLVYAFAWFLVSWISLYNGNGEPTDHLLVSGGLFLIHAAGASLIGSTRGYARAALWVPYTIGSIVLLFALLLYGTFIKSGGVAGADAMRAIAQTDPQEAMAYLRRLISPASALWGASISLLLVAMFPNHTYPVTGRQKTVLVLCIVIGAVAVHLGSIVPLGPLKTYVSQYRAEVSTFRALLESRKSKPVTGATSDFFGTAVIVIGESTSRRHMSLYGYFRETTPKLDAHRDRLLAFSDVISVHSHTVPALMPALTSSGATSAEKYFDESSIDIVSLARSAGFTVQWLSNQNEFGIWDNPVGAIAKQANQTRFFSSATGKTLQRTSYDGVMLPALRRAIANPAGERNLVFVHLFADHWPYCRNYPPEFRHFPALVGPKFFGNATERRQIDCYDDAIRYIDSILDEAIQAVDASAKPAVLLYFSDHGEAPLLGTGHDSFRHSSYQIEVPLLVWANDGFRKSHSRRLSTARSNVHRPYTTARLFHSIAQLIGIKHASVDSRHSLLSNDLVDIPRTAINGTITYDQWAPGNDYRENASINVRNLGEQREQVWAHRTNSLGAMGEAASTFSGVEMDVVFVDSDECFHVYHPPAPDTSLSLAEMLAAASKSKPNLRLWLDWKNATPQNVPAAITCLNALDAQFDIRRRSLVETGPDAVFREINLLSTAGYTHGYYLPTETILKCIRTCDDAHARELALKIRKAVEGGGYSAITFDWRLNGFVKRWLHDWTMEQQLALYSWDMSINIATDRDAVAQIAEHFSTLSLTALLVTFPSDFRI